MLFIAAPYLAVLSLAAVSIVRYALRYRDRESDPAEPGGPGGDEGGGGMAIWRWAIAVVLVGHLLALAFPAKSLLWNRQPLRLFLLEGTGVVTGGIALVALMAAFVQRLRASDRRARLSAFDLIAGTLITIQVMSGLGIAVLYRWASSWAGVTLAPYLLSLLRLEPSAILVADMPFLVRLHVFCAFAIVAVAPFTLPAGLIIGAAHRRVQRAVARVTPLSAPAWTALGLRTASARFVHAMIVRGEDREN